MIDSINYSCDKAFVEYGRYGSYYTYSVHKLIQQHFKLIWRSINRQVKRRAGTFTIHRLELCNNILTCWQFLNNFSCLSLLSTGHRVRSFYRWSLVHRFFLPKFQSAIGLRRHKAVPAHSQLTHTTGTNRFSLAQPVNGTLKIQL